MRQEERERMRKILGSGNSKLIKESMIACFKRVESDQALIQACNDYEMAEYLPNAWIDNAHVNIMHQFNKGQFLQREFNYLMEKLYIEAWFSKSNLNIDIFIQKLDELIAKPYFAGLDDKETQILKEYLIKVYQVRGYEEVVSFISKIRNLYITYTKKMIVKDDENTGLKTLYQNTLNSQYLEYENRVILDLDKIQIVVLNSLSCEDKKYAILYQLSHLLVLPIDRVLDKDSTISILDCLDSLELPKSNRSL